MTDWSEVWSEQLCQWVQEWVLVEVPGGWQLRGEVDWTGTGLVLRRLTIEPSGDTVPGTGITTRMLQGVRAGDMLRASREAARQAAAMAGLEREWPVSRQSGPRGQNDLYYARWAAAYVAALEASARPIADLAAEHHLSVSRVSDIIRKCRIKEMLTQPGQGRAGGQLTQKAVATLETEN
jgi:hypothetical protein